MIPELFLAVTVSAASLDGGFVDDSLQVVLADGGVLETRVDSSLADFKEPLSQLTERAVGETSRAVRFDWRNRTVFFGVTGSVLLELNNFNSGRIGGFVRVPSGNFTVGGAITYAFTTGSLSSELLALTPYRQAGRPSRIELDFDVTYALAEGVVTPRFNFIPATELVFNVELGFRYLIHPTGYGGLDPGQVVNALFGPQLSQKEVDNLDGVRVPSMEVDRGRYGLMGGFSLDVYLRPFVIITPRVLLALPLLSAVSGTKLNWWWEVTLAAGVAL